MPDRDLASYGALLLRLGLGAMFLAHSLWLKAFVYTLPGTAAFFGSVGLPGVLAYLVFAAEVVGGTLLIIGLQVRWVAIGLLPVLLGATWVHWPNGWLFTNPNGGFEYPLFLTLATLVQALLGDGAFTLRWYPETLRPEIDEVNAFIGPRINGGVYRAGFASTQKAYDAAVIDLFAALDALEARLATRNFLVGERLTEADLRLFSTLIRFDVAYYGALRCNLRRLADYPNLLAYTKRIFAIPGVAATVKLDHVKRHYWDDHEMINRRIVPIGPTIDFSEPAGARAA